MASILDNLTTAIGNLESSVKADLAEIRKQKSEVQRIKEEIYQNVRGMKYVREDGTLIISAPKIIIGDVDHDGNLFGESSGSQVIIRGNAISTEASGAVDIGGTITNKASSIRNIAVDPGGDGLENSVFQRSEIVNQARSITLQSNNETGCFSSQAAGGTGVNISSDTYVDINAMAPNKKATSVITDRLTALKTVSSNYASTASQCKTDLKKAIEKFQSFLEEQDKLNSDYDAITTNYQELYNEGYDKFLVLEKVIYSLTANYVAALAGEAEAERAITALTATKDAISSNSSSYETSATGAVVSINSESVIMKSIDADGNLRANKEAGLSINAPHLSVNCHDKNDALITGSTVSINTQTFNLSTSNSKYDSDHKSSENTSVGDVNILSKNVTIAAVDSKYDGEKTEETALTAGSTFSVRAETIKASATDTEGNSTGTLALNAKTMNIASMNVDKDTRADKEMAAESTLTVLAAKNLIGTTEKTTLVQLASDKIAVIAKTTAEMQQDGKAVVTLTGGNLTAGGSAVELDGDTTIKGGADIKGETKTPVLTADSVTASSAFKSPNISDTQGAGTAGSASAPSATLKEEVASTTSGS